MSNKRLVILGLGVLLVACMVFVGVAGSNDDLLLAKKSKHSGGGSKSGGSDSGSNSGGGSSDKGNGGSLAARVLALVPVIMGTKVLKDRARKLRR